MPGIEQSQAVANNEVLIRIDDRTKRLRFGEALVSGSTYAVSVEGGAARCGATAALVVSHMGDVVAFAELADGAGTLDLDTAELAKVVRWLPPGAAVRLDAAVRSVSLSETVGVGTCRLVASGLHSEDPQSVLHYLDARPALDGVTIKASPTQREIATALKTVITTLGGTVNEN